MGADGRLGEHQHSPGCHGTVAVRQENEASGPHESAGSKTEPIGGSHRTDEVRA